MSEVTVVSSFETEWASEEISVKYYDEHKDAVMVAKGTSWELVLMPEDVDTLVSLLVAYRNGFEFPPKPDPNSDSHRAFE